MFFIILDKNPTNAALKIPKKYKHKQLLELMQMISCVVDFGYEKLPTGKEIKAWINKNSYWVYTFAKVLMRQVNLKEETKIKYNCLLDLLYLKIERSIIVPNITTAIFRYKKEYAENTTYKTNSELPVEIVIKEYEKYIKWKKELMLV